MMLKLSLCNLLLYIFIILQLIYECDGQNRRRNQGGKGGQRKPRGNNDILPNLSYLWILLAMVFLPPIIYFIYNVIIIILLFFLF